MFSTCETGFLRRKMAAVAEGYSYVNTNSRQNFHKFFKMKRETTSVEVSNEMYDVTFCLN